jgi:hypothetical protein
MSLARVLAQRTALEADSRRLRRALRCDARDCMTEIARLRRWVALIRRLRGIGLLVGALRARRKG